MGGQGGGGKNAGAGGLHVSHGLVVEISAETTGLVPQQVLVGLDLKALPIGVDRDAVGLVHHGVHSVLVACDVGGLVVVVVVLLLGELRLLPLDQLLLPLSVLIGALLLLALDLSLFHLPAL